MDSVITESNEPSKPEIEAQFTGKNSFVEKLRNIRPNKPAHQGIYRPPSRLKLLWELKQEKHSK